MIMLALGLLDAMQSRGLTPDDVTLGAVRVRVVVIVIIVVIIVIIVIITIIIILIMVTLGLLDEMRSRGLTPDDVTLGAVRVRVGWIVDVVLAWS
jgi:hypothetical protein